MPLRIPVLWNWQIVRRGVGRQFAPGPDRGHGMATTVGRFTIVSIVALLAPVAIALILLTR
jgi:hypothetical protein